MEGGEAQPTFKQLERFAKATLTPLGALFLEEPPDEKLPVADFRTLKDQQPARPSAALMTTVQQMQRRQEWMREYLIEAGEEPLAFVGTVTLASSRVDAANNIRRTLGVDDGWASTHTTWSAALVGLRQAVEEIGVLVVVNGIVENNTRQKLDPEEFRGFVLCDDYAPLIFITERTSRLLRCLPWRTNWPTCGWGQAVCSTWWTSSRTTTMLKDFVTRLRRKC